MANVAHCKTAIIPEKLEVWQMLLIVKTAIIPEKLEVWQMLLIVKLQLFQKN